MKSTTPTLSASKLFIKTARQIFTSEGYHGLAENCDELLERYAQDEVRETTIMLAELTKLKSIMGREFGESVESFLDQYIKAL